MQLQLFNLLHLAPVRGEHVVAIEVYDFARFIKYKIVGKNILRLDAQPCNYRYDEVFEAIGYDVGIGGIFFKKTDGFY